jgi:hypothetical protein
MMHGQHSSTGRADAMKVVSRVKGKGRDETVFDDGSKIVAHSARCGRSKTKCSTCRHDIKCDQCEKNQVLAAARDESDAAPTIQEGGGEGERPAFALSETHAESQDQLDQSPGLDQPIPSARERGGS